MSESGINQLEELTKLVNKAITSINIGSDLPLEVEIAENLIKYGVIVLPRKLNLPDELYRYMFDNDRQPVVVKCKVVKITGYGFTLKHPTDGREWEYEYNSLGYTVFLTKEETVERIKALKGGVE